MENCSQYFFIVDGNIHSKETFETWINGYTNGVIYEVIRVINGSPLFLNEHILRLKNSVQLSKTILKVSIEEIIDNILKIIKINDVKNGNLKLIINSKTEIPFYFALWFQPHEYPTPEQYRTGVKIQLIELVRKNPNAKIQEKNYKSIVSKELQNKNIYELLLSHDGIVTEGSKSNIYFIQDNQLVTASRELVLQGITREKITELALKNQIPLIERKIKISELVAFQAAFITGTSPKVLPIFEIDSIIKLDVRHPLLLKIMKLYNQLIDLDIQKFKKKQ